MRYFFTVVFNKINCGKRSNISSLTIKHLKLNDDEYLVTDKGRIDGVLTLEDKIYLIEFKYGKASTQMDTLVKQAI